MLVLALVVAVESTFGGQALFAAQDCFVPRNDSLGT